MSVYARILKLSKILLKEMLFFFPFPFFSKETKPSMAGYEIWIIYLQTGHKSDPVLELNAYLVFKAFFFIHVNTYFGIHILYNTVMWTKQRFW